MGRRVKNMKAVLFDLDGTLVDSSEGILKCARYALKHYGMEETDAEKLKKFIGPPLSESFMKLYGFPREQAVEAVSVYRERYNRTGIFECSLYPGVEECLRALKEQGYLIGMASSKPEASCRKILEHFGLLEQFDDVVGATFDGRIETKEQVLREVLRRWETIPKDAMCLIGDTIFDIEGANLIGIPSIGVSFGFGDVRQMLDAGARMICDSMRQLPEAVARIL